MRGTTRVSTVLAELGTVRDRQEDFYRDLHANPELSHQEHRTASLVAARLREYGYEVHEGVGGTGVVGVLSNGDGATVLLRADMDALPIREATDLPYASTVTASGTPVMHACGHDVHVACLLGAAQLLAMATEEWSGTVIALFQPAEEVADGAQGMVDDGLDRLIPRPDVAFGQHVLPLRGGHPGRSHVGGSGQHADHCVRTGSAWVDAAVSGRSGCARRHDRRAVADRRRPRDRARRDGRAHRRQSSGRY